MTHSWETHRGWGRYHLHQWSVSNCNTVNDTIATWSKSKIQHGPTVAHALELLNYYLQQGSVSSCNTAIYTKIGNHANTISNIGVGKIATTKIRRLQPVCKKQGACNVHIYLSWTTNKVLISVTYLQKHLDLTKKRSIKLQDISKPVATRVFTDLQHVTHSFWLKKCDDHNVADAECTIVWGLATPEKKRRVLNFIIPFLPIRLPSANPIDIKSIR